MLPRTRLFPPYQARQRQAERQTHTDYNKGHGRRETRTIETTTALNSVLASLGWSSVRQVFRISRKRVLRDRESGQQKTTTEVVYGITDLTRKQADAAALLHYNRSHWGIENRVHYTRDVTFLEDKQRARTDAGPHVLSSIRNTASVICRLFKYLNLAEARRDFAWKPLLIPQMLGVVNK